MVILSENDYLDVRLNSLIADYDTETLTNLYQPIIGYAALAVYFTLIAESKNQKVTSVISHNQILNRLQMAIGDYIEARKKLEGVGLLRTFLEETPNMKVYHYQVYAPKTPFGFFDDTLLFGMLIKAIGDNDANRFKQIYQLSVSQDLGNDISSSFLEAYQPNFDDPAFNKALNGANAIGRRHGKINSEFNYDLFFKALGEISQITQEAFTKKDMKEIERLATLHGASEEEAANAVSNCFNPYSGKGKHVDFDALLKLFQEQTDYSYLLNKKLKSSANVNSGKTDLAKKINYMETTAPSKFLSDLQNGTTPAKSDLFIVNDMSKKFQLKNGVINVIVDYVLNTNNNILSRSLCEKISASIAREGITTAIDAMNYLANVNRKSKTEKIVIKETENPAKEEKKATKEVQNLDNWDELLDDIDDNGGNDNGKA